MTDPATLRKLNELNSKLGEDILSGGGTTTTTQESLDDEFKRLSDDPALMDRMNPKHGEVIQRRNEIIMSRTG